MAKNQRTGMVWVGKSLKDNLVPDWAVDGDTTSRLPSVMWSHCAGPKSFIPSWSLQDERRTAPGWLPACRVVNLSETTALPVQIPPSLYPGWWGGCCLMALQIHSVKHSSQLPHPTTEIHSTCESISNWSCSNLTNIATNILLSLTSSSTTSK